MDAFFASAEQRRNPKIASSPVIVGGLQGRGVVSTCSYQARKFGVHSGMAMSLARCLCPTAFFLEPDFELYSKVSRQIAQAFADNLSAIGGTSFEQASVDEYYAEFSQNSFGEAVEWARWAKKCVRFEHGLPCTVGVGENKLLAKMACGKSKPDGFGTVGAGQAKQFLRGLAVGELHGVGPKTAGKLDRLGIRTVDELARADVMLLLEEFGVYGNWLHFAANGVDATPVGVTIPTRSMGREKTFQRDLDSLDQARCELCAIVCQVHDELCLQSFFSRRVSVKARFADFESRIVSKTLRQSTDCRDLLQNAALELLEKIWLESGGKRVRLLGFTVGGLTEMKSQRKLSSFA